MTTEYHIVFKDSTRAEVSFHGEYKYTMDQGTGMLTMKSAVAGTVQYVFNWNEILYWSEQEVKNA